MSDFQREKDGMIVTGLCERESFGQPVGIPFMHSSLSIEAVEY